MEEAGSAKSPAGQQSKPLLEECQGLGSFWMASDVPKSSCHLKSPHPQVPPHHFSQQHLRYTWDTEASGQEGTLPMSLSLSFLDLPSDTSFLAFPPSNPEGGIFQPRG